MIMIDYKVLITTSGIGSRLGALTKYNNKSLVRIGKKPVISHIIEKYSQEIEFVITLGHYGDHVRDFLLLAYPDRKFSFVQVDNYDKPGSSLVHSIICAKSELQCSFVFHACDTIVTDEIPIPDHNWVAGNKHADSSEYRSLNVYDNKLNKINDKGEINFDYIYIGLAGIYDYKYFWTEILDLYHKNSQKSELSDCHVINNMLKYKSFYTHVINNWHDIGNIDDLRKTREHLAKDITILDKLEESIYIFPNFVIKFFYDKKISNNRVKRSKILSGLVPKVLDHRNNFYKYEYVQGDLYAETVNNSSFSHFLNWSDMNLWHFKEKSNKYFFNKCQLFYYAKTKERISKFLDDNNMIDKTDIINGVSTPSVKNMLTRIDTNFMCNGDAYRIHGDYILDNIITKNGKYTLLDWRQDFAGEIELGDIYYDLAKLNHNLIFNHSIVDKKLYSININETDVSCDILRSHELIRCQQTLYNFIRDKGFDLQKVKILSCIIWLNMSPLHEYPLNLFLFYFGKCNLWKQINQKI